MTATEDLMATTWEHLCTTSARLTILLAQHAPDGEPFVEFAVLTPAGLFEVDVAWARDFMRIRQQKFATPSPEVCIEVEVESNTEEEFDRKRTALFASVCVEFWIVRREGGIEFHGPSGKTAESVLVPNFPNQIDL